MVLASKRSGHHAIMEWLLSGLPKPRFRLNNISAKTARGNTHQVRIGTPQVMKKINSKDTGCLMYNVEQADLSKWSEYKLFKDRCSAIGVGSKVVRRDTVLVVRDPFNCITSAIRCRDIHCVKQLLRVMEIHYEQALGDRSYCDCYVINFNRWFVEPEYRVQIAQDLDLQDIDPREPYLGVPPSAGGSSFDGRKLDGKADEMNVLERYKQMGPARTNELKRFMTPQLRDLSQRLFGMNPEL